MKKRKVKGIGIATRVQAKQASLISAPLVTKKTRKKQTKVYTRVSTYGSINTKLKMWTKSL